MRYVDIDKPIFVRCVDDRSHEVVTTETTIAELLEDAVGFLPVEDDVRKVVLCQKCEHYYGDHRYCANDHFAFYDGYCVSGNREVTG